MTESEQQTERVLHYYHRPHLIVAAVMAVCATVANIPATIALATWIGNGSTWWPYEVWHIVALPAVYCLIGIGSILAAKGYRRVRGTHV